MLDAKLWHQLVSIIEAARRASRDLPVNLIDRSRRPRVSILRLAILGILGCWAVRGGEAERGGFGCGEETESVGE